MTEQFDLMGQSYEEAIRSYPEFRREELQFLLDRLDPPVGSAVLDFTAGTGFVALALLERVGPSGRVVAVDSSGVMLDLLRAKLPSPSAVDCVRTSDPTLTELAGQTFDRVVSLGGFHHVEHQIEVCRTLYRLLRPGGQALILDFADCSLGQEHFDSLVHDHNPAGHHALFLSRSRAINLARFADCTWAFAEVVRFTWHFTDLASAGEFFVRLHGLRCTPGQAAECVRETFDLDPRGDGPLALPFDYVAFTMRKPIAN